MVSIEFYERIQRIFKSFVDLNQNYIVSNIIIVWTVFVILFSVITIIEYAKKTSILSRYDSFIIKPTKVKKTDTEKNNKRIYYRNAYKKTLMELHTASQRCYGEENALKCIEILRYCPYLVNTPYDHSNLTPFHRVCINRNERLILFMLDIGGNPWMTTQDGENALSLTIRAYIDNPRDKSLSCLNILQKHGCCFDHTNKWYKIYLEAAALTGNKNLIKWIFNQSSKVIYSSPYSTFPPFSRSH